MTLMDEPIYNYVVTRGDALQFQLRIEPGGVAMDWSGQTAEIVIRLKRGGEIRLASPDDITLVQPEDLVDDEAPNLMATLSREQSAQLTVNATLHRYQVRVFDDAGQPTTVLKGTIDARFSAAEDE
jgi:hypothetical protein